MWATDSGCIHGYVCVCSEGTFIEHILCMLGIVQNTSHVFTHLTLTVSYEFSDFIFPIIEVRKRKLRENKQLAHDFSAHEWQSRDLNPHLLSLESTLLTIMLSRDNPPLVAGPAVWTHFMGIRPG